MKIWIIFLLSIICSFSSLKALEKRVTPVYTLEQLEELLLKNNPDITAAQKKVRSLESELEETKFLFGPEIRVGYSFFPGGSVGGIFAAGINQLGDITLTYPILDGLFGVRYSKMEKEALVEEAKAELSRLQNEVLFELRKTYFEALIEKEEAEKNYEIFLILKNVLALVNEGRKAGEILLPEVLEVEKEIIKARESYKTSRYIYFSKKKLIALLTGLEDQAIDLADHKREITFPIKEDELAKIALENSPEIRILLSRAKAAEARTKRAKFQYLSLVGESGYVLVDSIDRIDQGLWLRLNFSAPIFFKKLKHEREDRFMHEKEYWEGEARVTGRRLEERIRSIYDRILETSAEIESTLKEIEKSREDLRIKEAIHTFPSKAAPDVSFMNILKERIRLKELEFKTSILGYRRKISYYELLSAAGLKSPTEVYTFKLDGTRGTSRPKEFFDERGIWIWNTDFIGNPAKEELAIFFLAVKGIKQVFISLDKKTIYSLSYNPDLERFISKVHDREVKVHALLGENTWIYPEVRKDLFEIVDRIIAYNEKTVSKSRFDAVHLDIEPHAMMDWKGNEKSKLSLLVETYRDVREKINTGAPHIELWVDIPDWYDQIDLNLLQEIYSTVDRVVVMAYGKLDSKLILEAVKEELNLGEKYGKPTWVGLSSSDFLKKGEEAMEEIIQEIQKNSSFSLGGIAIHSYSDYIILAQGLTETSIDYIRKTNRTDVKVKENGYEEIVNKLQHQGGNGVKKIYILYLGSYKKKRNAIALIDYLKAKGYQALIELVELKGKGKYYRVNLGSFKTKEEAFHYVDSLRGNAEIDLSSIFMVTK
jgi:outer membrane protein TolC